MDNCRGSHDPDAGNHENIATDRYGDEKVLRVLEGFVGPLENVDVDRLMNEELE